MGFVVGYVPCGLSPQIDGMPVIPEKSPGITVFPRLFWRRTGDSKKSGRRKR